MTHSFSWPKNNNIDMPETRCHPISILVQCVANVKHKTTLHVRFLFILVVQKKCIDKIIDSTINVPKSRGNTGNSRVFSGAPSITSFPWVFNKLINGRSGWIAETVSMMPSSEPAAACSYYTYKRKLVLLF